MSVENVQYCNKLANHLKRDIDGEVSPLFIEVAGVRITYPYMELGERSFYERGFGYDNRVEYASFLTLLELFSPTEIPSDWINFLKEVEEEKSLRGCDYPSDLVCGVLFTLENNTRADVLRIEPFNTEEGSPDFSNKEEVRHKIDAVLADPELRGQLKGIMTILTPDTSHHPADIESIGKIISKITVPGVIVDLGCGKGSGTLELADYTNQFIIGMDRQYRSKWYLPWKEKWTNISFAMADFNQGIPLLAESVNLVLLRSVVQHITIDSLYLVLIEATRVLKTDTGLLVVGPQSYKFGGLEKADLNDGYWRYYKKRVIKGKQTLVRTPYCQLVDTA